MAPAKSNTTIASSTADPPAKKEKESTVVTKEQGLQLRDHYKNYSHEDPDKVRAAKRASAAMEVGLTPRVVAVKFGDFHRQVKRAAEKRRRRAEAAAAASK